MILPLFILVVLLTLLLDNVVWAIQPRQTRVSSTRALPPVLGHNLTSSTEPDPRFRLVAIYGTKDIDYMPLFMNAVNCQAKLAHQNFGNMIKGFEDTVTIANNDVTIELRSKLPARLIDNRLATWGLYGAIRAMIDTGNITEARFDLYWDHKVVAYFFISTSQSNRLSLNNSDTRFPTMPTNSSITETRGLQPHYRFVTNGARLPALEVFMAVLETLQILAYWPGDDVVYPFTAQAEGFRAIVQVDFGGPPRTSSPFLLVSFVIDTVRGIPQFMLQETRFAELWVLVAFKEVMVGDMLLYDPSYRHSPPILVH